MKKLATILWAVILLASCKEEPKEMGWKFSNTILLEGINPIGLAQADDGLWISDGDHFRVVKINEKGAITKSIDSLDRPMHIAQHDGQLVIPQYGNDEVIRYGTGEGRFRESEKTLISLLDSLDAPAGADIKENQIAIADFYNNRIHYASSDNTWIIFGKEGKADGEFYYPTDVQITEDALWVADAYNNRLQKFTKQGKHVLTVGEAQDMNAATGIFVSEKQVFSTDFENNRVLIFDQDGNFMQELKQEINKPTDMLIKDGKLYVANYKSSSLSIYEWSVIDATEKIHDGEDHDHDHHEEN